MSRRIRALLIDLSGTLHIGKEPIQGAVKAIQRLRDHGIPFRFCSNTSKESTAALLRRLHDAGFTIHEHELFTSLKAMKKLLIQRGIKRPFYLLSTSALEEFHDLPSAVGEDAEIYAYTNAYDAVIVGLAPERFTYSDMNEAFRILSNSRTSTLVPLLTTHRARYVRSSSGELSLGPGPFVSALEVGIGESCKAESIGKPARAFFEVCLRDLGVDAGAEKDGVRVNGRSTEDEGSKVDEKEGERLCLDEVAIVGDDIEADLGEGALELGLQRILVKTGKYREGDESRFGITPPDAVHDSIADFVDAILEGRAPTACEER